MNNRRVLISVDLDYFNHAPVDHLNDILSLCATAKVTSLTLNYDHLPDSYNAWPIRRGRSWRWYTIWNYDEHDDFSEQESHETIGNWTRRLHRKGANIIWISEPKTAVRCSHDGTHLVRRDPGALPSAELVDGLAVFTSPGYLNDMTVIYRLFSIAITHDMKINGRRAANWSMGEVHDATYGRGARPGFR